jgi:hypothetical protein
MSYGNSKSVEHCQTTDKANAGFGTGGLTSTGELLKAGTLQDGGASQKGAKNVSEQQP